MKMMVRYRLFQILSKQTLKQTLAIIILLSIHAVMQAQTPDFAGDTAVVQKCWPLRMLDTVLDFRDNIVKNDTSYIARLPQKLKLGFAVNCSGADINARGSGEHGDIQSRLSTNIKTTVSANIAYRGLGIGIKKRSYQCLHQEIIHRVEHGTLRKPYRYRGCISGLRRI